MQEFSSMFSQLLKPFPRTEFQALVKRPWQLYRAVFQELLGRCQAQVTGRRKLRFKNKLVSLDSTVIDLCATLFDWAKFRRTKGAIKLHCLLDHDGYLPSVVVITEGKRHDVRVARTLRFDPGTIVVMDRGYVDYAWFGQLTAQGVFSVTRLKTNTAYRVVERRAVPARGAVLRDELIELTTSANALKVQVWTALIAILLFKYLQLRSRFGWSLSNLVALLRMNLFTHRDLWTWLDHPFEGPPTVLLATQGELALA